MFTRAPEFFGKREPIESEIESSEKKYSEKEFEVKLKKLRKFFKKLFKQEIEKILILKHVLEQVNIEIEVQDGNEMTSNDELKIPRFSGTNYSIRKDRILLFFEYKECLEPATRDRINETEAVWKRRDLKARNIIYYSVTDEQLEFVRSEITARAILKKFDQLYLRALQLRVRSKLNRLNLRNFDSASEFFVEFEKLINELQSACTTINEREKLDYLLKTLPESMFHFADIIDSMLAEERTCEFLKNKISMWKSSRNDQGKKKHSVFKAEKKNGACHRCGRFGHFKQDYWTTCQAGSSSGYSESDRVASSGAAPAHGLVQDSGRPLLDLLMGGIC